MTQVDSEMIRKLAKALELGGGVYTLDEILRSIHSGKMQGHVNGETWAVTEVQNFPRQKVVHILLVVGTLEEAIQLENEIITWAKSIGVTRLTAIGRDGWWKVRTPGWGEVGTMYAKDL